MTNEAKIEQRDKTLEGLKITYQKMLRFKP
jgi:hypothetical protein